MVWCRQSSRPRSVTTYEWGVWNVTWTLGTRVVEKMAARLGIGAGGDRARTQRKALLGEEDATLVFETSKEVTVVTTFDQMSLKEDLLRGIYAYGKTTA